MDYVAEYKKWSNVSYDEEYAKVREEFSAMTLEEFKLLHGFFLMDLEWLASKQNAQGFYLAGVSGNTFTVYPDASDRRLQDFVTGLEGKVVFLKEDIRDKMRGIKEKCDVSHLQSYMSWQSKIPVKAEHLLRMAGLDFRDEDVTVRFRGSPTTFRQRLLDDGIVVRYKGIGPWMYTNGRDFLHHIGIAMFPKFQPYALTPEDKRGLAEVVSAVGPIVTHRSHTGFKEVLQQLVESILKT